MKNDEYTSDEILTMLMELPDACCVFKVVTDPFGTVTDMEFIFANERYAKFAGRTVSELIGSTFYQMVSNRDEDWMRISYQAAILRQPSINRSYNTQFEIWLEFWAVPVYKKGYCAFIIHDVTAVKEKEKKHVVVSNSNQLMIECAKALSREDFAKSARVVLKKLGETLRADRAFVVEADKGRVGQLYEWIDDRRGIGMPGTNEMNNSQVFAIWNSHLNEDGIYIEDDTKSVKETDPEAYSRIFEGKINRYSVAALMEKEEIIGYLVIENYVQREDLNLKTVLETVATLVAAELKNYRLTREMSYISTHDALTSLGNRYAFIEAKRRISNKRVSVGICFVDLNGLKLVNDQMGHTAGDQYIQKGANLLSRIFHARNCYRIGGDEFVAVVEDVSPKDFEQMIKMLRNSLENSSEAMSMAIGHVWIADTDKINEAIKEADNNMYKDKRIHYLQMNENDKNISRENND
ncbi:MAG: sensor domain-containing diguanylate cyclase [Pseudobutyrivibrio sp.]|nr:sensor domain-containing diguanylate cyclase [Pseudobutyrivibrio sp.]